MPLATIEREKATRRRPHQRAAKASRLREAEGSAKSRLPKAGKPKPMKKGKAASSQPQASSSQAAISAEELKLMQRAEQGDTTVLPALQELLDRIPELWRGHG